jgi:NTP pyrophosphatase (non-canonical NTP hydrolase)
MMNNTLDLTVINRAFRTIAEINGWQAYHTPKNLAAAVSVESAELLEIFQWLTDEQSMRVAHDTAVKTRVADEVADIVMYLTELCVRLDIDMGAAIAEKIEKNKRKGIGE